MKKNELKKLLTINLQLFNDGENSADESESDANGGTGKDSSTSEEETEKEKPARSYSDADVDRIIAKKKAAWEKEHAAEVEKAKEEARKYERMSKEQREEADRKKAAEESAAKDKEIAELKAQIAMDAMRKTVAADVEALPEEFVASQDFLDLTVTGDADESRAKVEKLKKVILADRKAQEQKRARGNTPRSYGSGGKDVSGLDAVIAKYSK